MCSTAFLVALLDVFVTSVNYAGMLFMWAAVFAGAGIFLLLRIRSSPRLACACLRTNRTLEQLDAIIGFVKFYRDVQAMTATIAQPPASMFAPTTSLESSASATRRRAMPAPTLLPTPPPSPSRAGSLHLD